MTAGRYAQVPPTRCTRASAVTAPAAQPRFGGVVLRHESTGAWDWPSLGVARPRHYSAALGTRAVGAAAYPCTRRTSRRPGSGNIRGRRALATGIRPRKYHQPHQFCSVYLPGRHIRSRSRRASHRVPSGRARRAADPGRDPHYPEHRIASHAERRDALGAIRSRRG